MKKLITFIFLFISFNSIAVTNQELMDRLDDLEWEAQMREGRQLMDEARRAIDRMKQENQQLRNVKPSNPKYKIISTQPDGTEFDIALRTIEKNKLGSYEFLANLTSEQPKLNGNIIYYSSMTLFEINCLQNKYRSQQVIYFDKNNKVIAEDNKLQQFALIKNSTVIAKYRDFLCK
jgi:hypothetical protein